MTEALRLVPADEARELLKRSTPGPWHKGNQWMWAGVMPKRFGDGKCAYCHTGKPDWVGRADINGTRMLAHRHADPHPYEPDHYIYGPNDEPVTGNWDYDTGGVVDSRDADMIANAPDLAHTAAVLGEQRDAVLALVQQWLDETQDSQGFRREHWRGEDYVDGDDYRAERCAEQVRAIYGFPK